MKKFRTTAALLLALIMCLGLAACGGGGSRYTITIENQTGYVLSDIRMSPYTSGSWGDNRLSTELYDGESTEIRLGSFKEDDLAYGFSIQVFDEYDDTVGAADDVYVHDGDTLTLYLEDGNLACSTNGYTGYDEYSDPGDGSDPGETGSSDVYDITIDDLLSMPGSWYACGDTSDSFFIFDETGSWYLSNKYGDDDNGYCEIEDVYGSEFQLVSESSDIIYIVTIFDSTSINVESEGFWTNYIYVEK